MKGEESLPLKIYINALFSSLTEPDLENLNQKCIKGLKETLYTYNLYTVI